jgi:superfamily II DNA or RNA helicase
MTQKILVTYNAAKAQLTGDVTPNIRDHLREALTWQNKNAAYLAAQKGFNVDTKECCYNTADDSFSTGLLPRVLDKLSLFKCEVDFTCNYPVFAPEPQPLPDWAYDHQREIVNNAIENYRTLIQSPTGSGKSYAIAFFIKQFASRRVLITVPSINLLHNIKRPLESILEEPIGMIGDGKCTWERVTVGIINSLSKHSKGKFKEELEAQEILVVDEAHIGACASMQKISNACINTTYRLGLSATAYRTSGDDLVLEGVLGPKSLIIPEDVMVKLNVIHAPKAFFVRNEHQGLVYNGAVKSIGVHQESIISYPNTPNNKPDPDEVYIQEVVRNSQRNKTAIKVLRAFLDSPNRGGNALLIIHLIEHGKLLQKEAAKQGLEIPFIDGSYKGKDRMEVLDKFREGQIDYLIASSILNEGEDLPMLELLINCAGRANKRITTQRNGRSLRIDKSGRKKQAIIVDFYDDEPFYLNAHARKRMNIINQCYYNAASIIEKEALLYHLRSGKV